MPNQYTGPLPLLDRLWSHIDRSAGPDACWPWMAALNNCGYGQIWHQGKTCRAHRLLDATLHGPIPAGMLVLHRCDNRICCNPAHLFRGTTLDNARDRDAKGRRRNGGRHPNMVHGEQHHNAVLTEDLVRTLRARYVPRIYGIPQLAREFGLAKSTVYWIVSRQGWKHLS